MDDRRFIGRKKELKILEDLYASNKFEMLVLHGRRRIGKSFLLAHFASEHKGHAVYFTADKSSEKSNVQNFCAELNLVLDVGDYLQSFEKWKDVYSFIKGLDIKERLVIIIDEFTYLYNSNPAYDSELQNAIDRILCEKNLLLILCGSEVSAIEEIFDNSAKPLYGRKTAEMKLLPFTYREARGFFPKYDSEQAMVAYSILGGIPLYLSLFDDSVPIRENVIRNCLSTVGYLFEEVNTLLRMELKETYFYKEILSAISNGATDFNTIKTKIGEDAAKIAKYIRVLLDLGFVKKEYPCGKNEKGRNALYSICDNFFAFYFSFIYKYRNMLNGLISPDSFYDRNMNEERLHAFVGHRFESVCETYLKERFYEGSMPFYAECIGRWWGGNPATRKQEEIDIVALDGDNALFCECKYTNERFDEKELDDLLGSAACIDRANKYFMIFTKSGVTDSVQRKIRNSGNITVVMADSIS